MYILYADLMQRLLYDSFGFQPDHKSQQSDISFQSKYTPWSLYSHRLYTLIKQALAVLFTAWVQPNENVSLGPIRIRWLRHGAYYIFMEHGAPEAVLANHLTQGRQYPQSHTSSRQVSDVAIVTFPLV